MSYAPQGSTADEAAGSPVFELAASLFMQWEQQGMEQELEEV